MEELIEVADRFYILADSALSDARTLALKDDDTFGHFNALGDIEVVGHECQGLFTHGMRHLSRWQTRINGMRPLLLSSRVADDNTRLIIDLTNPDMTDHGTLRLPRGTLHLLRSRFIRGQTCFERLAISNFATHPVQVTIAIAFDCDFADIFEVRGTERRRRGKMLQPIIDGDSITMGYDGLDGVRRSTILHCAPRPGRISESEVTFDLELRPRQRLPLHITISCEPPTTAGDLEFRHNAQLLRQTVKEFAGHACNVTSPNHQLAAWLRRSYADLRMLMSNTEVGQYPYAGVPYYSTPFGRDGIITALQTLWINPSLAEGVLKYLAAVQADELDPANDAEPGKILHERRTNEMAATGEVPFGRYYGSVDATPLFIILAGAYWQATGDDGLIQRLWPNIDRALHWIDEYGDIDGDGFVDYQTKSALGLINQGWKDSHDAIFHADGSMAEGPIALCEVQGYVYDAKLRAADMAGMLKLHEQAQELRAQAHQLRRNFHSAFWNDELGTYVLALDGEKRQCAVRTSNAGHCLFSGIADEQVAARVCENLMDRPMFSGWGVRTVASSEARYNPMSYHNGSIWPHDNAMIAAGFARYRLRSQALRLFNGWFDASSYLELHRLPELICGFRRYSGKGPTLYPVACNPQAWAAGSVFMLLSACLGLWIDGHRKQVHLHRPRLPQAVDELRIQGLKVARLSEPGEPSARRAGPPVREASLDLLLRRERRGGDVGVLVTRKDGEIDIVVTK